MIEVHEGRPAANDGRIHVGDKLLAVDDWPCTGKLTMAVTAKILGPVGA